MSQEIRTSWAWRPADAEEPPAEAAVVVEVDLDDHPVPPPHPPGPARGARGLAVLVAASLALGVAGAGSAGARALVEGYLARLGAPSTAAAGGTLAQPRTLGPTPSRTPSADGDADDTASADGPTSPRSGPDSNDPNDANVSDDVAAAPAARPHHRAGSPGQPAVATVALPAPRWTLLDDGTWLTADLAAADRPLTRVWGGPDAVAVDLVLRTASLPSIAADSSPGDADPTPVTTGGRPARLASLALSGLGRLSPDPGQEQWLPRIGRTVVHARLLADCTGWWTGPGQLTLTLAPAPSPGTHAALPAARSVSVSLADRTPADVLTGACPSPRRGVALSLTRARPLGPGRVEVRVINHGSRPARLHLSPGWLDGQVRLDTPGHAPVTLQPGHAVDLEIVVSRVTPSPPSERPIPQAGRTSRTDPMACSRLSVQLADAVLVQGSDPADPDLGLVTAGDIAWGTDTFGHALSVAGLQCSPSGPSRS